MDLYIFKSLLQRLLDLCRRLARRSLHTLLRIYSALSARRTVYDRHGHNDNDNDKGGPTGPLGSTAANPMREGIVERSTTIACSSMPKRPPPARKYTRHTTIDSFIAAPTTASSPTSILYESPGAISPSSYTMGERSLVEEPASPLEEIVTAEPAHFIMPPIKPFKSSLPSLTSRYKRKIPIKNDQGPWKFGPLETITVYDDLAVPQWNHHVQPDGQLYFCNTSRRFNYLTDSYLCDDTTLAEANLFVSEFERKVAEFRNLPPNVDVVIENSDTHWLYYMVDLDRRCFFWLDDCVVDDKVLPADFGVENREQLRHIFDFEFWQYTEFFPNHHPLRKGLLEELLGTLLQMHIDVVTSLDSTSPFDGTELQSLIGSVKHMQDLQDKDSASAHIITATARLMAMISNERFFNFTGFHGARLSQHQSVRGEDARPRSLLIKMLSPILFYSPEVHLNELEKLWIDYVIKARHWKVFQSEIERDWEGFVLYATVLLNANVGFLSIPSVLSSNFGPMLWTSPAAIVSQVSMIASLGSIIIALLLARQMRTSSAKESVSVEGYLAFIENRSHPQLGLEVTAILYSLPYALLMWGMVTFLASVAIICFFSVNGSATIFTRTFYGVIWLFIIALILWTILTGWEKAHSTRATWRALVPEWLQRCSNLKRSSNRGDAESGMDTEESMELESPDTVEMETRSVHSVRSRLTASSTTGGTWHKRVRRLAQKPKRSLTWLSSRNASTRQSFPFFEPRANST